MSATQVIDFLGTMCSLIFLSLILKGIKPWIDYKIRRAREWGQIDDC